MTGNFLQQEFVCFMYHLGRPLMSMLPTLSTFLIRKKLQWEIFICRAKWSLVDLSEYMRHKIYQFEIMYESLKLAHSFNFDTMWIRHGS